MKSTPCIHEELELKNSILNSARAYDLEKFGEALPAVFIYLNIVDYLVRFLLSSFSSITSFLYDQELNGLSIDENNYEKSLGENIHCLEKINFPGKKSLIEKLKKFNPLRITYAHNLFNVKKENFSNLKSDFYKIKLMAEEIIDETNKINSEVLVIFYKYLSSKVPTKS